MTPLLRIPYVQETADQAVPDELLQLALQVRMASQGVCS